MAGNSNKRGRPEFAAVAPFFNARSLAIIGASSDPLKQGGRPVRYARLGGFKGRVYPINLHAKEVQGLPAYPSILAVEGPVDCAFIALPAAAVADAVQACAEKGVRAAVIISAGFAETGARGRRRQDRIVAIARAAGMRLIGPNCMGMMDVHRGFFATFLTMFGADGKEPPRTGNLSLVSQSGAFGAHAYALARARGVGFAKWVTTGNECDVQVGDCIAYLAEDSATRVIMVYMEGCRDPEKLMGALRLAHLNRKPVIVLKAGKSDVGVRATLSHTGALAGSDAAFDGLCRQWDVHRAGSIAELLDVAVACAAGLYPSEPKVGLLTISGGVGALMADAAEEFGLRVPPLPVHTQKKLLKLFPFGVARNPIDPTALWSQDMSLIARGLEALLADGGHDMAVIFASTIGVTPHQLARFREHVLPVRRKFPNKLVILSMMGSPETVAELEAEGFLIYEDPRRALEVAAALARLAPIVQGRKPTPKVPRVARRLAIEAGREFSEFEAMEMLERAGIPFVSRRLATSATAAARAAAEIGFPAVLKISSPDIAHKTEIGGVALGLNNRRQTAQSYRSIIGRMAEAAPGARLDGVMVAAQIEGGVETILGVSRDPGLGPVVMFGMGGIFVEIYQDVVMRIAPFGTDVARAMIREIRGFPILAGTRGGAPADIGALARALSRLSIFAAANAETIESIDINPFIVLPRGRGALGVDALIVPRHSGRLTG